MAVLKCKMCGGDIELSADKTFGTCEFCGSAMTLPKIDDEQRAAAFNRGNHFRRSGEFDKALAVYERIVQENDADAEAHWCCALCRFGIEYVEDPSSYEWLPTCHRASFDSFLEDVDYLAALEHSDGITKRQYQKEAVKISEVQKGILATSQNEEPFDVFICYKESEEDGSRTRDSIMAQDIYYQLTEQGRRVFFSRITLENKAGAEYEPYIFAALNSARVMVAVGTSAEHYNAVWVKNEWSRFLALMRKDRKKLLLPCYKDMDPYDMPEQLSVLQSYDMGKIGFIQDLIRGVNKVLDSEKREEPQAGKETVVVRETSSGNSEALLERGNMALEDGEWEKADEFFEEVLNQNAKCAEAYIGKLLARDNKPGFASWLGAQKEKNARESVQKLEAVPEAAEHINKIISETAVPGFFDSDDVRRMYSFDRSYTSALSCRKQQKEQQLAELKNDRLLSRAKQYAGGETAALLASGEAELTQVLDKRIAEAEGQDRKSIEAIKKDYADFLKKTDAEAYAASEAAAKTKADAAAKKKKTIKIASIVAASLAACLVLAILTVRVFIPNIKYNAAVSLMERGDYKGAIAAFEALDGYKDSAVQLPECRYLAAVALMESGDYDRAIAAFEAMEGYKDRAGLLLECRYLAAVALMESGDYLAAYKAFDALNDYKDSKSMKASFYSDYKIALINAAKVGDVVFFGAYEQDNDTSNGKEDIEWKVLKKENNSILVISRYALDCQKYNTSRNIVKWETCSLREWLNDTFLNSAFSSAEQALIQSTEVSADKNPKYDTNPGNDTTDKVFLLSIAEVEEYFSSDESRKCVPTAYTKAQGAYTSSGYSVGGVATCWWWLRSPGRFRNIAAAVHRDGSVYYYGDRVDTDDVCVRPALWINLNS